MEVIKMRRVALSTFFLFVVLPIACSRVEQSSDVKFGGNRVGEYRGYVEINQTLRTRLLESGTASYWFSLGRYIGENSDRFDGLPVLLGGFSGEATNNDFRNGNPNAMNMLLWQIALSGLAGDVAGSCGTNNNPLKLGFAYKYNDQFAARLKKLCAWPAVEAKTEDNLLKLWLSVMSFDAPKQEYEAWRDFFLASSSPFANSPSKDAVKAMMRAMLLSPYFLLEH
jgi:hypothetical protein